MLKRKPSKKTERGASMIRLQTEARLARKALEELARAKPLTVEWSLENYENTASYWAARLEVMATDLLKAAEAAYALSEQAELSKKIDEILARPRSR